MGTIRTIKYKEFIEEYFLIRNKKSEVVPFKFNVVQHTYYNMLNEEHPNMQGARQIILKARQEGFTSFISALFATDFLFRPNSVSVIIAHDRETTKKIFKKIHFYLDSYCHKAFGQDRNVILKTNSDTSLENNINGAQFYIRTAGAKVGARGDTVNNLHFSECAFYPDTDIITAKEIVEGSLQQVPLGTGMVFIESTANGVGNYYQKTWELAKAGSSTYTPRFFSWHDFPEYTDEYMERKRKEFSSEAMFKQEYPATEKEAFILSGSGFFDSATLFAMQDDIIDPIYSGDLLSINI